MTPEELSVKCVEWPMSNKHGIFRSIQKKIPQSRVMDNNDPEGTRRAERVIWEPTKTHPKDKKKKKE